MTIQLSPEEQQIENDIVSGLYIPLSETNKISLVQRLKQASKNRQTKKTISIRLDPHVIHIFKAESLKQGIPYQTLMASRLMQDAYALRGSTLS